MYADFLGLDSIDQLVETGSRAFYDRLDEMTRKLKDLYPLGETLRSKSKKRREEQE